METSFQYKFSVFFSPKPDCSIYVKSMRFCEKIIVLRVLNSFHVWYWTMVKQTLKIMWCEHRRIFKACLAIFQHNAWKRERYWVKIVLIGRPVVKSDDSGSIAIQYASYHFQNRSVPTPLRYENHAEKNMFQWKEKAHPIWKLERSHSDPVWWKHSIM